MNTLLTMDNFRGLVTAVLLGLFVWLVAWAWSKARRPAFDAAARMALEEDASAPREASR